MTGFSISIIQINLHHSKCTSVILTRSIAVMQTCTGIVQEPWLVKGVIRGLGNCSKFFKANTANKIRTCIITMGVVQLSYHSSVVAISLLSKWDSCWLVVYTGTWYWGQFIYPTIQRTCHPRKKLRNWLHMKVIKGCNLSWVVMQTPNMRCGVAPTLRKPIRLHHVY